MTALRFAYVLLTMVSVSVQGEQFQIADSSSEDASTFNAIEQKIMQSWKSELGKLKNLTKSVPCTTKFFAEVSWPNGVSPKNGGTVKYDDILEKPKVIWPCYGSKYYGLIFANLEILFSLDLRQREHLWLVYNIPGNQVDRGVEAVPYHPPEMKSDTCRVIVLIHEQTKFIEVDDDADLSEGARADKATGAFDTFNGTLAAGHTFTVEK
ncbi:uncharacterized protein LOC135842374 [Planococcus citri]|uniref:uncharacterized protein LOC135842374 n=1 Tax=Planococcus citri TaxID=170843 RepID=UPI0031F7A20F